MLTAAIAKNPKIDVIVSDFGPSLVGALPVFAKSGRSIPALATSDGNSLSLLLEDAQGEEPGLQAVHVATGNDNVRLAVDWAVARPPAARRRRRSSFKAPVFEDSVSGTPHPVTCRADLPGDVYLSAQMPGADQAKLCK